MKTFVTFPIMLTCKRFAAHAADERSLVGVGAKMRTEVVGTGEAFRTQVALEGSGMLLGPLCV
jgi:hypothetical protein